METTVCWESEQDLLDIEWYLGLVMESAADDRQSRTRWVEIADGHASPPPSESRPNPRPWA